MGPILQEDSTTVGRYVGVLAVDVREFSKYNNDQQKAIVALLPEIMQQAAMRARVEHLWQQNEFLAPRGDGYLVGFSRDLLSAVVDKFFDALQVELRLNSPRFRSRGIEVRLRAAVDLGPVHAFDAGVTDSPAGSVMVNAVRLADSQEVRALLEHSDPVVTFVASAVSQSVMKDVVSAGRTVRRPSEFVETSLRVPGKGFSEVGYLRVPAPSGELLRSGLLFDESTADESPAAAPRVDDPDTDDLNQETNFEAGHDVSGDVQQRSVRDVSGGVSVTGDNNVTAGRDQTTHNQDFSGTFLTGADANFGPASSHHSATDDSAQKR
ncbi:hypothetical protein AB0C38_14740 [Amycolatopsis sp. NPDC048633]|uniref:hypothetical protein n=1 Tax=Amycolatopsis sp. NPDC048633 TaxID=3157095 RepID=UPI0033F47872